MSKQENLSQEDIKAKVEYLSSHRCNHTLHKYIDISGDLIAGTLLSQILYWFSDGKNGNSRVSVYRDGYYWLAKRREDWMKEIRISKKQYDCAIKKLTAEIEPTEEEKKKNPGNKGKRREKKFDKSKALVVVKTFHFRGVPVTHIRPVTENINRMVAEWEEALAREIAGEENVCSPNSPNGNLANTPNVNMENDETEICYNIYNNINNISTEITNRDYSTENTPNSFSKEKGSNSPEGVQFSVSETEDAAPKREKPVRKTKEKIDRETPMPLRAGRIAYRMYGDKNIAANTLNFMQYFLEKRKQKMGREHIILSDATLERIVDAITQSVELYYDNEDFYTSCRMLITDDEGEDDYREIVDAYFEQNFKMKVDYSLPHFIQDNVMARLMLKVDKDKWCCCESI